MRASAALTADGNTFGNRLEEIDHQEISIAAALAERLEWLEEILEQAVQRRQSARGQVSPFGR